MESYGQHGHMTMAVPDAAFSVVQFSSYTILDKQYDRPS